MVLSFTEKRALQKTVSTNLAALAAGNVSFTDKRRLQKEITEAMAKLNAKVETAPSYADWERAVTDIIIQKLDVPNGDAQGIVEAKALVMQQAWAQGLDAQATADKVLGDAAPAPGTLDDLAKVMPLLKQFIGKSQLGAVQAGLRGEESQFFIDKMLEIAKTIQTMPKTYETDGQGDSAKVYLHYFKGGSDWYIAEKDMEAEQEQAWGYVILNGDTQMAETGYISITELIESNVELDFYWDPKTIGKLKGIDTEPEPEPTPVNQDLLDLQAGKFNGLDPIAFLGKLKQIADAINDIEPLKLPAIAYIEQNADKVDAVMESAVRDAFGKLWGAGTLMESAPSQTPYQKLLTGSGFERLSPERFEYAYKGGKVVATLNDGAPGSMQVQSGNMRRSFGAKTPIAEVEEELGAILRLFRRERD